MSDAQGTNRGLRDGSHAEIYGHLYWPTGEQMIGVSFQPGAQNASSQGKPQGGTNTGGGVQEAIKVLSLRLPRVVGAQAVSPGALLNAQGGGSRVDSIVNQILAKYFPGSPTAAQNFGSQPSFDPYQGAQQPQFTPQMNYASPFGQPSQAPAVEKQSPFPRVVVDVPPYQAPLTGGAPKPGMATPDGGFSPFPGMIDTLPKRTPFSDYPDFGGYELPREEPRI